MKFLKFTINGHSFEGKKAICRELKVGQKYLDLLISRTKYSANLKDKKEYQIECKGKKVVFQLMRQAANYL